VRDVPSDSDDRNKRPKQEYFVRLTRLILRKGLTKSIGGSCDENVSAGGIAQQNDFRTWNSGYLFTN